MARRRVALALVLLTLLAFLLWELYDPPGEELEVLSLKLGTFIVVLPDGEARDLGPCNVGVKVLLDPGRPGISLALTVTCELAGSPPEAVPAAYSRDLVLHVVLSLPGRTLAEGELPVGGLVMEMPWMAGYELVDAYEPSEEGPLRACGGLEDASGYLDLELWVEALNRTSGSSLAVGWARKVFLIPPAWALPVTLAAIISVALLAYVPIPPRAEVAPPRASS